MSWLAVTSMRALNISFCGALALGVSDEKSDDILIHLLLGIIICIVQGLNYSPLIILWYYVESKIKNFFSDHYYIRLQIIICLGVHIFLIIWKIFKTFYASELLSQFLLLHYDFFTSPLDCIHLPLML